MNLSGSYHKGYSQHLQYLDSIKSSTKDLSHPLHEIIIYPIAFNGDSGWYARAKAYLLACCNESGGQHCLASMDSDLEAFSRSPTDDSFVVFAFLLATLTKYLNEVFLSY